MGLEADCEALYGGRHSGGEARLEATELVFKGEFRLRIPFAEVRSVEAKAGVLHLGWREGVARFRLGVAAEKWALKIRYPRPLLDKLGVKPAARVSVLGRFDPAFRPELESRAGEVSFGRARKDSDLVLVAMTKAADLARLKPLRNAIKKDGGIWVVWPKGRPHLREDDVRAAGPGSGLVDVKVVSFSETLSALKLVIPRSQR